MGQQVPQRRRPEARLGGDQPVGAQVVAGGRVEVDQSLFPQLHDGDRGDGLGDRVDPEDCVLGRPASRPDVGDAVPMEPRQGSAADHPHRQAGDRPAVENLGDRPASRSRSSIGPYAGVVCPPSSCRVGGALMICSFLPSRIGYLGSIGVMMPSRSSMRRRGIEAQVFAVPGADHLHGLGKTVPDAHGKRHGGQPERVDGYGHAHACGSSSATALGPGRCPLEAGCRCRSGRRSADGSPGTRPTPAAATAAS